MSKKNQQEVAAEEEIILTGKEKEIQTDTAKCPACGSEMSFFPENQTLKCEHCGTETKIEIGQSLESSLDKLFEKTNQWNNETHVFSCNNCGAKEVLSKDEIVTNCSYCGTSNIIETSELSGIKPTAVVPFKITKENAVSRLLAWAKKKFFAPKKFKKDITAQNVKGIFNPAFTFDAQTLSYYRGRLGKYVYTTTRVNGKTVTQRHTRWFNISGTFSMMFDDILIQASTVIEQKTVDKLQPFATNESKSYTSEFLHGYSANQYTKDGKQCWAEAQKLIDKQIRKAILRKYTYDVIDSLNISTQAVNQTYKYMLLPVYVGHFSFKKKSYNFFVSGHNGKIVGKTPVSGLKILLLVGLVVGVAAVIGIIKAVTG